MGIAGKHFPSHVHDNDAQSSPASSSGSGANDERMRGESRFGRLLGRPEFAAISGTVLIFAIFAIGWGGSGMFDLDGMMNWSQVAAYLGILAVGACLLMIAGEFDLSIGSMIGFSGMMVAIPTMYFHWPVSLAILFAFAASIALGALNGYLVMRTRLPSFIVTLAFLFILRGLTLALSIMFADRTIVSGVGDVAQADWLTNLLFHGVAFHDLFRALAHLGVGRLLDNGEPLVRGVPKVILWWFALVAIGAFVLAKTRYGNWILAVGGDANAAKNVGVPVKRVKISLFMLTAFCACLFAVLQVCDIGSAAADRGLQKEFEAIIAAVIGGTLLTGGYGSVIGAAFGALIFGVVQIGITYTSIDSDWFRVFLGLMLLMAVLFNHYVRRRVAQS
ncbi:ABC transporter permease [Paraburkholderia caballeronis]|uniref:ABC transporter permease n=1 Tax=Paraburkholderia caballeronis TaxID=416943 RepID=UPI001067014F|nr:ABC transporter permease [Paraburkholderia caballeronis]TDV04605.1 monosaccharide ABC transporter membrane protein (CUT2 family) [Paraburkholderia caballeronis]TDV07747.1 monosaccharide ABC transporter membrane protein (CUT2 family) [Paraburkholderia caballeronis]TDV18138.1 monosaccharide ABC transporter membrane protein (CUT2 family) [Paraburkholderia caballeronis]